MPESWIENYIKAFVMDKTAERVHLDLKSEIYICPHTKKGSILLATFWANVLQHPQNYPQEVHLYRKQFDSRADSDTLVLPVDVTFTLYMKTGLLRIEGEYVYEWFTKHFIDLLDNTDLEFLRRYKYYDPLKPMPAEAESAQDDFDIKTETERYMLMLSDRDRVDAALDSRVKAHTEDLVAGLERLSADQPLLEGEELTSEVESLGSGGTYDGYSCVYRLWKSLLRKWLLEEDTKVFCISPRIDSQRMKDLFELSLTEKYKGIFQAVYTSSMSSDTTTTTQVKNATLEKFEPKEQAYIEYAVSSKLLYPVTKFVYSLAAGVKDGKVEMLLYSGNCNADTFTSDVIVFATYQQLDEVDFQERYIVPLSKSAVVAR